MTEPTTRLRRAFLTVLALRCLPIGLTIAIGVLFMTDRGLSLAQVGLVFAVHGVTVAVLELPTGGFADALGRKPVLVIAAVLFLAATILFVLAQSFAAFAAAYLLTGIARSLDSGPLEAWYVDEVLRRDPDHNLEHDLSRAGVVLGVAISAGSLLAGVLGFAAARGWLGSVDPLVVPLIAAVVMHAAHVAATALLITEHRPPASWARAVESMRAVPRTVAFAATSIWRRPGLRAVVAVELFWGASLTPIETLWQPRMADLLGGARDDLAIFGGLSAAAWAASAAGALLVPLSLRLLRSRTDVAAVVMKIAQGLTVLVMAAASGVPLFAAGYLATYVVHGAANPVHMALLHRRAGGTPRATLLSVNSLMSMAGGVLGGVAITAIAGAAGIPFAYVITATLLFAVAPLYLVGRDKAGVDSAVGSAAQELRATSVAEA